MSIIKQYINGEWTPILIGKKGDTGDTGPQGLPGADGVDGDDGISAYQVAVNNGFVGTEAEWLTSLVGPQGPAGSIDNVSLSALNDVEITSPLNNQIIAYETATSQWKNVTLPASDLVNDTTPQLGGDLDVNGNSIVSVSNGNINITPNGTGKTKVKAVNYDEGAIYTVTYTSTITPDVANGNTQQVTLTGNVTFSAFSNPVAGQSLTLIIKQDATGSRTLTSTMKFAGGSKTLTTTANAVDIVSVYFDGTNYWASLGKDFK